MIGDQPDVLPAKWRKLLRCENVQPGLHARGAARALPCHERGPATRQEKSRKNGESQNLGQHARESAQMVPLGTNHPTIQ